MLRGETPTNWSADRDGPNVRRLDLAAPRDYSVGMTQRRRRTQRTPARAGRGARGRARTLGKAERRAQILGAARDAFSKLGYHQTTIDDIVAAAGVARGTFYLYFDDKRAVFSELIDALWVKITAAIVPIVTDDVERPVAEQVRENLRRILGVCLNERDMTKILLSDAAGIDPTFDRRLRTFYDEVVQLLTQSLRDGQALGIVGDGEPRVLAHLAIGALKEILVQVVTLGLREESADATADQVFGFLRHGLLRIDEGKRRRERKPRE